MKPRVAKQACTHDDRPEPMDQKDGIIPITAILGVGETRSALAEKTYKCGYGIRVQPLATCIGERQVFEH